MTLQYIYIYPDIYSPSSVTIFFRETWWCCYYKPSECFRLLLSENRPQLKYLLKIFSSTIRNFRVREKVYAQHRERHTWERRKETTHWFLVGSLSSRFAKYYIPNFKNHWRNVFHLIYSYNAFTYQHCASDGDFVVRCVMWLFLVA